MDDPIDPDPDPELTWPRRRRPGSDARVLEPIFGAYYAARHRLEDAAREHGLDAAECMVLAAIKTDLLGPPWAIRRRLGLTPSTLTGVLDRLERDDRIIRRSPGITGRRFEIDLTIAGRLASDVAIYAIRSLEAEIAGYTSPDERIGAIAVFQACRALDRPGRAHP